MFFLLQQVNLSVYLITLVFESNPQFFQFLLIGSQYVCQSSLIYDESKTNTEQLSANLNQIINQLISQKEILIKKSDKVEISIAITTFNRPNYLEKCIESISHLVVPSNCVEVVIVNDGSTQKYDIESLQKNVLLRLNMLKKNIVEFVLLKIEP